MKAKFGFGIVLAALAASSYGQTYRSIGKGEYAVDRDKSRIVRSELRLTGGRSFDLSVELDDRKRVTFEGTWSGNGEKRDVRVTSTSAGRRVRASGFVRVDDGVLKIIDITGDLGDDRLTVKYTGMRDGIDLPGRPTLPGGREVAGGDTTGKGRYQFGRDNYDIKTIFFSLRDNGSISLTIRADRMREVTYLGRWTGSGDNRRFELTNGGRGSRITGSGSLKLSSDRKEVRSVSFSGRIDDDRLTIDFRDRD